jgi:hypothetical protein
VCGFHVEQNRVRGLDIGDLRACGCRDAMQALSSTSTSCWDSVVEAVQVVYGASGAGYPRATGNDQTTAD